MKTPFDSQLQQQALYQARLLSNKLWTISTMMEKGAHERQWVGEAYIEAQSIVDQIELNWNTD